MGSIVLAGVLLKLGGLGFFLFSPLLTLPAPLLNRVLFFVLIASIGVGLICFRQKDLKILIAFSRVSHMALVIYGLLLNRSIRWWGGVFLMVGHGLIRSLLFYVARIQYVFTTQRSFFYSRGTFWVGNFLWFLWVRGVCVNAGFPPFLRFLGEIFLFTTSTLNIFLPTLFLLVFFVRGVYAIGLIRGFAHLQKNTTGGGGRKGGEVVMYLTVLSH